MRKKVALVAHDFRKDYMVQLVKAHKEELAEVDLIATRSTGQLIHARTGLPVTLLETESLGGDQQIGALVASGKVDAVILLCDPLTARPHEPDISALLRVCDVHNVLLATNIATAEAVLHLVAEHPEVVSRHDLVAKFLEEIAAKHE